jgi:hypothetical protein
MIRYTFLFEQAQPIRLDVDELASSSIEQPDVNYPDWTLLERHRCDFCATEAGSRRTCPAALAIQPAVEAFKSRISYEKTRMQVTRGDVRTEAKLPIQEAARAVFGLLMGLSDCPVMLKLKPMARFHVPLAGPEHTVFRFIGSYLIAQYLKHQQAGQPDWDLNGLVELANDLHRLNVCMADRLRDAAQKDAAVNSLVFLDMFTYAVRMDVEESLQAFRPLFAGFLDR